MAGYKHKIYEYDSIAKKYNEYVNRLRGKQDYLIKKGLAPKDPDILSKSRFEKVYMELKKSNREQGGRASASEIIDTITTKQLSKMSSEQAKLLVKTGHVQSITRAMYSNMWDVVSQEYDELRDSGLTATEAKKVISQSFFGSQ